MVDIVQAPRSSGSILKPFLYQKMLEEGQILPTTLLPDVPFKSVKNFYQDYDGAVPANKALARSLNVPAVYLLQQYGVEKFQNVLKTYGFNHFDKPADYYGLSLIIGGGEITLLELANAYTNMAYQLKNASNLPLKQINASFIANEKPTHTIDAFADPSATYLTFKALKEVIRPESETGWQNFSANPNIAWKTGTSHGFRDAWAVGITPEYVVAVWVGNADGEGRPDMTGTKVAAPVLFDIFEFFRTRNSFNQPQTIAYPIKICSKSGYRIGEHCETFKQAYLPKFALKSETSPYHQIIFLDETGQNRVNSNCYPIHLMIKKKQFVLPTKMAWFYQKKNPFYESLPPFLPECKGLSKEIDLIYPRVLTKILIPKNLNGAQESIVFEAVNNSKDAILFWHIDDEFIKQTVGTHKIEVNTGPGNHVLLITDMMGNEIKKDFVIVE